MAGLLSLSLHSPLLPSLRPSSRRLSVPSLNSTYHPKSGKAQIRRLQCRAQVLADFAPTASAAYGTLLLGGGLFAYLRSGSKGSVFGGLAGGALMAVGLLGLQLILQFGPIQTYYLMQSPETKVAGDAVGFGSAFLFASVFGIRLYNTKKLVPSGLLLILSLGALALFFSAYMQDKM